MSNDLLVFKLKSESGYIDGALFSDDDLISLPEETVFINLENANITDKGIQCISGLKNIRCLDLDSTNITDDGMRFISKIETLEELWIEDTAITDKGILRLHNLKKLKFISVSYTDVTERGIQLLKSSISGIEVLE